MEKETVLRLLRFLLFCVIFMMCVGALTRLTNSGLSIPEWPLINGTLMYPTSDSDWDAVFRIYKAFPQYQLVNTHITLDEFKTIFFFEYFHRSLTSLIGILLVVIFIGVYQNKKLWKRFYKNYVWLFFLLIIQALAGYLMVRSGLSPGKSSVSQYWLAFHLSMAALFLTSIAWTYWQTKQLKTQLDKSVEVLKIKKYSSVAFFFVFLQIVSGAFMAGTKAGYHFADWPFMNGQWIPEIFSTSGIYATNYLKNFTENIANIQFFHRLLAYFLAVYLVGLYFFLRKRVSLEKIKYQYLPIILFIQIFLGIITLMLHVPIYLGVLHQLGAIALLLQVVYIRFYSVYRK